MMSLLIAAHCAIEFFLLLSFFIGEAHAFRVVPLVAVVALDI
jgi:hypothetical protein